MKLRPQGVQVIRAAVYIRSTGAGEDLIQMNEAHFSEIEKVLLYITDARERAAKAAQALSKAGAEAHLVSSLEETERSLKDLHRKLMQSTYFAVVDPPSDQERLAV